MRKAIMVISIILVLLTGFFTFDGPRITKNAMGSFLGYGTCPNCNDNWWWKSYGDIFFEQMQGETQSGVMICNHCLSNADSLNPKKIEQSLIASKWEQEKAASVRKAVEDYIKKRQKN